jgi:hypothetical protein
MLGFHAGSLEPGLGFRKGETPFWKNQLDAARMAVTLPVFV